MTSTHKFVVLLNKKIESGVALNAAAHMAACLAARANEEERSTMTFVDYQDADGNKHPTSALSLIVLQANNSNQIRQARPITIEKGMLHTDFLESMTKDTYVEQMERTKQLKENGLEYWGLCLFGKKEEVDSITRKFNLWRR